MIQAFDDFKCVVFLLGFVRFDGTRDDLDGFGDVAVDVVACSQPDFAEAAGADVLIECG